MTAEPAPDAPGRSLIGRPDGVPGREVTAQVEHHVVAALLALRHRAERSSSAGSGLSRAPEAGWRRTRLAALGLLPRFPRR